MVTLATVGGSLAPSAVEATGAPAGERPAPPRSHELARPEASAAGSDELEQTPVASPEDDGTVDGDIFPDARVVSFWGSPQLTRSILGRLSARAATKRLIEQAAAYERRDERPVVPAFNLVAAIATADAGRDGMYRSRQSSNVIDAYLRAARRVGARLILDVQPGRAKPLAEVRVLARWLREPDVDLAIDPEWNVGPRGVPGRTDGVLRAATVNSVSAYLARLVDREGLPQKLFVLHQFRSPSLPDRDEIIPRAEVASLINFDGIGSGRAKKRGYERLSSPRLFNGFSLFYSLDQGLLSPAQVLRLRPEADFVMYQ